ncbi:MAG: hypothetical protein IEMM0006_0313 [bacterium]|nr:MAG: hypothetical protein IEMM0006_0313 [bacterium]
MDSDTLYLHSPCLYLKINRKQVSLQRKILIPKIMGKFKMQISKQINILRKTPGTKTWQHDYHDQIIRNDTEYQRIKKHIRNNPLNWKADTFFV